MPSNVEITQDLIRVEKSLQEHEHSMRLSAGMTAGGLALAGVLEGVSEFVPNENAQGLLRLSAIGIAFLSAVGPGLDAMSMRFDFVSDDRRTMRRLVKRLEPS